MRPAAFGHSVGDGGSPLCHTTVNCQLDKLCIPARRSCFPRAVVSSARARARAHAVLRLQFWNARFSTSVDFKAEHHRWKEQDFCDASAGRGVTGGSILQYPFLLDPDAKYGLTLIFGFRAGNLRSFYSTARAGPRRVHGMRSW